MYDSADILGRTFYSVDHILASPNAFACLGQEFLLSVGWPEWLGRLQRDPGRLH